MKPIDPLTMAEEAIQQLSEGAFLTVKAGDKLNTMTIGWATIGYIWQRPVLMVAVRKSRHTFGIIEDAADFTVSIPHDKKMQEAIDYCGTRSGRDVDKFKECRLETRKAKQVHSPLIKMIGLHFECKIIFKTAMDPAHMDKTLEGLYPIKDFHTLYFGEIKECYETN